MSEQTAESTPQISPQTAPEQQEQGQKTETVPTADPNKGLDEFVAEATKTKAQEQLEEKQQVAQAKAPERLTRKQALSLSQQMLRTLGKEASEATGNNLCLPPKAERFACVLFAPVLQKYDTHIQKFLEDGETDENLDSWWPEIKAVGGAAAVGGYMYWAHGEQEKLKAEEAAKEKVSGDKPKQ